MGKKNLTHNHKFMYLEQMTRQYRDTYQYKELKLSNFKTLNQKDEVLERQQNRKRLGQINAVRREDLLWRFDIFNYSYPLAKFVSMLLFLWSYNEVIQIGYYTSGATFRDVYHVLSLKSIFHMIFDEWRSMFFWGFKNQSKWRQRVFHLSH